MLSYMGHKILGMNTIQLYMKVSYVSRPHVMSLSMFAFLALLKFDQSKLAMHTEIP